MKKFEWDLDGDGDFERKTGSNPVTSANFPGVDQVTVTVRVSDDDGKYTDETKVLRVAARR